MIWALILLPALAGGGAFFIKSDRPGRALLLATAAVHFGLTAACWRLPRPIVAASGWLAADALSLLFLSIASGLFLAVALYSMFYLGPSRKAPINDYLEGFTFENRPDAVFIGCLLLFLASMSTVTLSRHLGVLWVAVEATTLASAPLIYHHRHHRSLEAAWKYLLICSVGISLALLGNFFLAVATSSGSGQEMSLTMPVLLAHATEFSPEWLKAAFLLMLVGYGTKMGLAPMHTWLPDAHSEAPSPVSALLSGALLNCAFLAILRMQTVLDAAGLGQFGRTRLIFFGLLSMGWAAMLLISQTEYKRMLAYSSVEHVGVMAVGVGIGGVAAAGAMLQALNHSLAKAALFLVAGNILAVYRSKDVKDVRGILAVMPATGALWLAGILAVTGSPPFGLFVSELLVLKGAVAAGRWWVAGAFLAALVLAFVSMAWVALKMAFGRPQAEPALPHRSADLFLSVLVPAILVGCVLVLGLWVAGPVWTLVTEAAAAVGGGQ
ncbi:MAG: proton-conducting transporter membrane subunit [Thermodesulfobacteriota bacterium]